MREERARVCTVQGFATGAHTIATIARRSEKRPSAEGRRLRFLLPSVLNHQFEVLLEEHPSPVLFNVITSL